MPYDVIKSSASASAYIEHIARRHLAHQTMLEIASATGLSRATVSRIMNTPMFLKRLAEIQEEIYKEVDKCLFDERVDSMQRVRAAVPKAVTSLIKKIDGAKSERVQFDAAVHLMGLAGHVVVQKQIKADVPVQDLPLDQQRILAEALASALVDDNVVINVKAERVED